MAALTVDQVKDAIVAMTNAEIQVLIDLLATEWNINVEDV